MRCVRLTMALASLAIPLAACGPSGGTTATPSTAAPPAGTSPTPAGPTYTIDQVKAALVKDREVGAAWKNRPGVVERNGPAPCAADTLLPVPTEAQVGRADFIDQRNDVAGGVFVGNTISQIGLVFADSEAASSYLRTMRSANSACPVTTTVPQQVQDGNTTSAYAMTIGVQPLTIASWQGFMLTADKVYVSRGFADVRVIMLGRGNAVIVLSLGALTAGSNATKPSGWDLVFHGYFDRIFYRVDGSLVPARSR